MPIKEHLCYHRVLNGGILDQTSLYGFLRDTYISMSIEGKIIVMGNNAKYRS